MIHIVLAMDKNYWHKANEFDLFNSLKVNLEKYKIHIHLLAIGFDIPEDNYHFKEYRWNWYRCEAEQMRSFTTGWPKNQKNRSNFICAEGGDFFDFFDLPPTSKIIHIDADMILQRPFTQSEIDLILNLRYGEIAGTFASIPSMSLRKEAFRLNPQVPIEVIEDRFPNHIDKPLICSGLIACTAKTYKDVIYHHYLKDIKRIQVMFDHHAAGQWLMNYVIYEHANFYNLGHKFHHADWFIGSDKEEEEGKLLYNGDIVLFNHHKFNKRWSYLK